MILHILPKRWHGYLYLFAELCTLVFAGFALYWSLDTISTQLQFDSLAPALRVSQVWFEAAVPLGFSMMVVRILQSAWRDIQDIRAGRAAYAGTLLFD
jgi:TRAP-type C4-dicarboxylate transport system permease small subunit